MWSRYASLCVDRKASVDATTLSTGPSMPNRCEMGSKWILAPTWLNERACALSYPYTQPTPVSGAAGFHPLSFHLCGRPVKVPLRIDCGHCPNRSASMHTLHMPGFALNARHHGRWHVNPSGCFAPRKAMSSSPGNLVRSHVSFLVRSKGPLSVALEAPSGQKAAQGSSPSASAPSLASASPDRRCIGAARDDRGRAAGVAESVALIASKKNPRLKRAPAGSE